VEFRKLLLDGIRLQPLILSRYAFCNSLTIAVVNTGERVEIQVQSGIRFGYLSFLKRQTPQTLRMDVCLSCSSARATTVYQSVFYSSVRPNSLTHQQETSTTALLDVFYEACSTVFQNNVFVAFTTLNMSSEYHKITDSMNATKHKEWKSEENNCEDTFPQHKQVQVFKRTICFQWSFLSALYLKISTKYSFSDRCN